jgi:hypothetical protein
MGGLGGWVWCFTVVLLAGCAAGGGSDVDGAPDWAIPRQAALVAASPVTEPSPPVPGPPIDCNAPADMPADHMPEDRIARPETFWAEDIELRAVLASAIDRLRAATGLELSVARGGVEAMVVDLPEGVGGNVSDHIAIDVDVVGPDVLTVMLHELGHVLGAMHLGPWEGVMSRCYPVSSALLTAADLVQICSAAPCTAFQPEIQSAPNAAQ